MTRTLLTTLPFLALTSCFGTSPYDGTYQATFEFKGWTCNDPAEELHEPGYTDSKTSVISVYETTEGSLVVNHGGSMTHGTRDGRSFDTAYEFTSQDTSCGVETLQVQYEFSGEFTKDLGLTGDWTTIETEARSGCQGTDDYQLTCQEEWEITAYRLSNDPDMDPNAQEDAHWGYVPSFGY